MSLSLATSSGGRRTFIIALVLATLTLAVGMPIGARAWPVFAPFLPFVMAASITADLITSYLLYRQFLAGRSASLAILGAAYLWMALCAFTYLWTFPSVTDPGFLGSGPQTAITMWALWHLGFPAFVLAYIIVWNREARIHLSNRQIARAEWGIPIGIFGIVALLGMVAIVFHDHLPILIASTRQYTPLFSFGVIGLGAALCALDIALLLRPARVYFASNTWIATAILAMFVELLLTQSGGRYSLGWYLGRGSSAISASILMFGLLYEAGRMTTAVAQAERRLKAVVDGVADALLSISASGRVEGANPAAESIFGYTLERLTRLNIADLIPDFMNVVRDVSESGTIEAQGRRADESAVPLELSLSESDLDGSQTTIVIARDVTERRRAQDAIASARDQALETARVKSNFLATMSHEIRTPINGVLGMTELLLESELNDEQRDYAETVKASADVLLGIINEILDHSKLEAGKMELDSIPFSLLGAVESAADILAAQAHSKGLALVTFVDPELPRIVIGDANRVRQILLNLLSNAVKFTPNGNVTVRTTREGGDDYTLVVRFEVTDTGIGLSEATRAKLFTPFTQADGSTSRKFGGTGLGLSISKRLVEMMDGEIGVRSDEGGGSTFWFTARFEQTPDQGIDKRANSAHSLIGRRVLIVDDDASSRLILKQYLVSWQMDPTTASGAEAALAMLRAAQAEGKPFDIALLDYLMPHVDGIELNRRIAADAKLAMLHRILITAHDAGARTPGGEGFSAFLRKPVRQSSLYDALHSAVEPRPEHAAPLVRAISAPVQAHSAAVLLAEDHPVNTRLALQQLKRLGYVAKAVPDGQSAVEAVFSESFAVVLMDMQMPIMDGFEATREIRRREMKTGTRIPIIAMTANAMEGDREACIAAGMDDYLPKPVEMKALQRILETWTAEPAREH